MKVREREVKIFVIGFFTCLLVEAICDWKGTVESVKRGYNAVPTRDNSTNKTS